MLESIALESLRANKLRTFLTMLGIIIGVASVIALMALGAGVQASISDRFSAVGTNLLTIRSGAPTQDGGRIVFQESVTLEDAAALQRANLPTISAVAAEYNGNAQFTLNNKRANGQVVGTTPGYRTIRNVKLARGQFITDAQVQTARPVVVLGSNVATTLFGGSNPIGKTMRIKGLPFTVVGVRVEEGGGPFGSPDEGVIVPITVAQQTLFGTRTSPTGGTIVSTINVSVRSEADNALAQQQLLGQMRRRHRLPVDGSNDDFNILSQAALLSSLTQVIDVVRVFLASVAGISLLVGGIGVMNIMLVSVTERTREIGLRKAVGARRFDILRQFMVEALVVSICGGLLGLALGIGIAQAVALTGFITPTVTWGSVALALGFSAAVGLFFGIYPATRAARLNPIQALRYE